MVGMISFGGLSLFWMWLLRMGKSVSPGNLLGWFPVFWLGFPELSRPRNKLLASRCNPFQRKPWWHVLNRIKWWILGFQSLDRWGCPWAIVGGAPESRGLQDSQSGLGEVAGGSFLWEAPGVCQGLPSSTGRQGAWSVTCSGVATGQAGYVGNCCPIATWKAAEKTAGDWCSDLNSGAISAPMGSMGWVTGWECDGWNGGSGSEKILSLRFPRDVPRNFAFGNIGSNMVQHEPMD